MESLAFYKGKKILQWKPVAVEPRRRGWEPQRDGDNDENKNNKKQEQEQQQQQQHATNG